MIRNYCVMGDMKAWKQMTAASALSLLLSASGVFAQTNVPETGQVIVPTRATFLSDGSANIVPASSPAPIAIGQTINLAQPITVARPALATKPARVRINTPFPPPPALSVSSTAGRIEASRSRPTPITLPAPPQKATQKP
jgi:hypothetical protein